VDIDGTILMPEVGIVHVAGFTRSDIESVLQERYSVYYESTDIVVQIKTQGKKYFIFGEVGKEGEVKHPGDLTIFEAVMSAGPSENSANLGRVRLMRPDPIDPAVWTININDMLDRADMTFNMQVQEYDIIFVPATMLAEFAYFIDDLLFPVQQLLRGALGPLFGFGRGGRGRGRGRGAGVGSGGLFGG
jgi:polysaccharide export outer membrane protein